MIEELISKKRYMWQYLYSYGFKSLLYKLKLNEVEENYETCKIIKDVIIAHNKLTNDALPTKL